MRKSAFPYILITLFFLAVTAGTGWGQTVTLISPNTTGLTWSGVEEIEWSTSGFNPGDTVYLELSSDGGVAYDTLFAQNLPYDLETFRFYTTTLADGALARRALKALGTGIGVALLIAVAWGLLMPVDPQMPGMPERVQVGPGDLALALASGCAGVLAFTTGAPATLVGVMVAVALLPPLVTCGLLLGSGHLEAAWGALLVFLTNVICVNLAGIVTFLFQGVRPLSWWETQKAKRASRIAIALWVILLLALSGMILLSQN